MLCDDMNDLDICQKNLLVAAALDQPLALGTEAERLGAYNEALGYTEHVQTYWRLLWEDVRYKGGEIGDESEYFLVPNAAEQVKDVADDSLHLDP
jgi:hypothetical protein